MRVRLGVVGRRRGGGDGSWLASGGFDKKLRLWDVKSQKEFAQMGGHAQVCTKPRFSRFSIWISVDLSAVWPCFHHRYSSFTSQTRVPHLHALICVQITPQIANLRTKTSVFSTPGRRKVSSTLC